MEKYGFVYIWYDKKHKRFYIGCRWGKEDDGYICSSPWMKQGYKHRPEDFRRKILSRIHTNRKDLLEEEYRWLSKIKTEELGKRYYNLHNHHFGHWTTDKNKNENIRIQLSELKKGKILSNEHKMKIGISNKSSLKGKKKSIEAKKKMSDYWTGFKWNSDTVQKRATSNIGKKRDIVECPHCKKTGGINAMKMWHFDKCSLIRK